MRKIDVKCLFWYGNYKNKVILVYKFDSIGFCMNKKDFVDIMGKKIKYLYIGIGFE